MTTYKIRTTRDNLGNHGWAFIDHAGIVHNFRMVGRIWKLQSEGWTARRTVIYANGELFEINKAATTARPMKIGDGEVYLPISQTGRKLLLSADKMEEYA